MDNSDNGYKKILDAYHKERNTKAFYNTQGFKKLWYAIKDIVKKESFQKKIKKLRKENSIPLDGFKITQNSWVHPPKEWKYSSSFPIKFRRVEKIRKELKIICKDNGFLPQDWTSVFEDYLFYNKFHLSLNPNSNNLCFISDMSTKRDSTGREITDTEIELYPITLHISPYASKRDILDYTKKIFKTEIEPLQNNYKNQSIIIGKSRKKKIKNEKRDEFIYQNQDWSLKDLRKQIKKEFNEDIDEGAIGKIISLENKRRN